MAAGHFTLDEVQIPLEGAVRVYPGYCVVSFLGRSQNYNISVGWEWGGRAVNSGAIAGLCAVDGITQRALGSAQENYEFPDVTNQFQFSIEHSVDGERAEIEPKPDGVGVTDRGFGDYYWLFGTSSQSHEPQITGLPNVEGGERNWGEWASTLCASLAVYSPNSILSEPRAEITAPEYLEAGEGYRQKYKFLMRHSVNWTDAGHTATSQGQDYSRTCSFSQTTVGSFDSRRSVWVYCRVNRIRLHYLLATQELEQVFGEILELPVSGAVEKWVNANGAEVAYVPAENYSDLDLYAVFDTIPSWPFLPPTRRIDSSTAEFPSKTLVLVTFDANGGTMEPDARVVQYGGTYGENVNFIPDAYSAVVDGSTARLRLARDGTAETLISYLKNGGAGVQARVQTKSGDYFTFEGSMVYYADTTVFGVDFAPVEDPDGAEYSFELYMPYYRASPGLSFTASALAGVYAGRPPEDDYFVDEATGEKQNRYGDGVNHRTAKTDAQTAKTAGTLATWGSALWDLPIPSAPGGREFLGWFSAPSDGVRITEETVVDENSPAILYAHWGEARHTLKIVQTDGGTVAGTWTDGEGTAHSFSDSATVGHYGTISVRATPQEGKRFVAWSDGMMGASRDYQMFRDEEAEAVFEDEDSSGEQTEGTALPWRDVAAQEAQEAQEASGQEGGAGEQGSAANLLKRIDPYWLLCATFERGWALAAAYPSAIDSYSSAAIPNQNGERSFPLVLRSLAGLRGALGFVRSANSTQFLDVEEETLAQWLTSADATDYATPPGAGDAAKYNALFELAGDGAAPRVPKADYMRRLFYLFWPHKCYFHGANLTTYTQLVAEDDNTGEEGAALFVADYSEAVLHRRYKNLSDYERGIYLHDGTRRTLAPGGEYEEAFSIDGIYTKPMFQYYASIDWNTAHGYEEMREQWTDYSAKCQIRLTVPSAYVARDVSPMSWKTFIERFAPGVRHGYIWINWTVLWREIVDREGFDRYGWNGAVEQHTVHLRQGYRMTAEIRAGQVWCRLQCDALNNADERTLALDVLRRAGIESAWANPERFALTQAYGNIEGCIIDFSWPSTLEGSDWDWEPEEEED